MTIRFVATIPQLQSAFNLDGDEDGGARLKLDIPGHTKPQRDAIMALWNEYRGRVLSVTVEDELPFTDPPVTA